MGWRWSAVAFRRHAKASSMSESDEGLYWILKNDGWWRNFWRLSRRAGEIQKYTGSARATKNPWNVEFQGFLRIAGYCWLRLFVPNPTRAFPSILKSTNVKKQTARCQCATDIPRRRCYRHFIYEMPDIPACYSFCAVTDVDYFIIASSTINQTLPVINYCYTKTALSSVCLNYRTSARCLYFFTSGSFHFCLTVFKKLSSTIKNRAGLLYLCNIPYYAKLHCLSSRRKLCLITLFIQPI